MQGVPEHIAESLRADFAASGMTQGDLHRATGLSRPWISRFLSKDNPLGCTYENAAKIAKALGGTLDFRYIPPRRSKANRKSR